MSIAKRISEARQVKDIAPEDVLVKASYFIKTEVSNYELSPLLKDVLVAYWRNFKPGSASKTAENIPFRPISELCWEDFLPQGTTINLMEQDLQKHLIDMADALINPDAGKFDSALAKFRVEIHSPRVDSIDRHRIRLSNRNDDESLRVVIATGSILHPDTIKRTIAKAAMQSYSPFVFPI